MMRSENWGLRGGMKELVERERKSNGTFSYSFGNSRKYKLFGLKETVSLLFSFLKL